MPDLLQRAFGALWRLFMTLWMFGDGYIVSAAQFDPVSTFVTPCSVFLYLYILFFPTSSIAARFVPVFDLPDDKHIIVVVSVLAVVLLFRSLFQRLLLSVLCVVALPILEFCRDQHVAYRARRAADTFQLPEPPQAGAAAAEAEGSEYTIVDAVHEASLAAEQEQPAEPEQSDSADPTDGQPEVGAPSSRARDLMKTLWSFLRLLVVLGFFAVVAHFLVDTQLKSWAVNTAPINGTPVFEAEVIIQANQTKLPISVPLAEFVPTGTFGSPCQAAPTPTPIAKSTQAWIGTAMSTTMPTPMPAPTPTASPPLEPVPAPIKPNDALNRLFDFELPDPTPVLKWYFSLPTASQHTVIVISLMVLWCLSKPLIILAAHLAVLAIAYFFSAAVIALLLVYGFTTEQSIVIALPADFALIGSLWWVISWLKNLAAASNSNAASLAELRCLVGTSLAYIKQGMNDTIKLAQSLQVVTECVRITSTSVQDHEKKLSNHANDIDHLGKKVGSKADLEQTTSILDQLDQKIADLETSKGEDRRSIESLEKTVNASEEDFDVFIRRVRNNRKRFDARVFMVEQENVIMKRENAELRQKLETLEGSVACIQKNMAAMEAREVKQKDLREVQVHAKSYTDQEVSTLRSTTDSQFQQTTRDHKNLEKRFSDSAKAVEDRCGETETRHDALSGKQEELRKHVEMRIAVGRDIAKGVHNHLNFCKGGVNLLFGQVNARIDGAISKASSVEQLVRDVESRLTGSNAELQADEELRSKVEQCMQEFLVSDKFRAAVNEAQLTLKKQSQRDRLRDQVQTAIEELLDTEDIQQNIYANFKERQALNSPPGDGPGVVIGGRASSPGFVPSTSPAASDNTNGNDDPLGDSPGVISGGRATLPGDMSSDDTTNTDLPKESTIPDDVDDHHGTRGVPPGELPGTIPRRPASDLDGSTPNDSFGEHGIGPRPSGEDDDDTPGPEWQERKEPCDATDNEADGPDEGRILGDFLGRLLAREEWPDKKRSRRKTRKMYAMAKQRAEQQTEPGNLADQQLHDSGNQEQPGGEQDEETEETDNETDDDAENESDDDDSDDDDPSGPPPGSGGFHGRDGTGDDDDDDDEDGDNGGAPRPFTGIGDSHGAPGLSNSRYAADPPPDTGNSEGQSYGDGGDSKAQVDADNFANHLRPTETLGSASRNLRTVLEREDTAQKGARAAVNEANEEKRQQERGKPVHAPGQSTPAYVQLTDAWKKLGASRGPFLGGLQRGEEALQRTAQMQNRPDQARKPPKQCQIQEAERRVEQARGLLDRREPLVQDVCALRQQMQEQSEREKAQINQEQSQKQPGSRQHNPMTGQAAPAQSPQHQPLPEQTEPQQSRGNPQRGSRGNGNRGQGQEGQVNEAQGSGSRGNGAQARGGRGGDRGRGGGRGGGQGRGGGRGRGGGGGWGRGGAPASQNAR